MATDTRAPGGRLDIKGVQKRFGEQTAIENLDLVVEAGEFISLLGPSGCGKTTLLRMIAGFEQPTRGSIELAGKDIVALPPHRRPVNTVFQSYALFPHMSVAENVAYGLKQAKVPRSEIGGRVKESLDLVRMASFADRKPQQLSGGQQQRVALARALVNRPQVLLLDEPMSALDRKLREEMQLELKRLHVELGMTFVFVTHDQEEALAMSDRIAVMNTGVIQQLGTAEEVYTLPNNRFVAGFIGKQNFVTAAFERVENGTAILNANKATITVDADRLPGAQRGDTITVSIRPEVMRIAPLDSPAQGANTAEGTVIGVSFLGDVVQYMVDAADGQQVLARVPAAGAEVHLEGAPVRLSWNPEAVQVFPHE